MALDAAHRSSILEKLRPILGDDDANALMSQFPAAEASELVTKDFLRAELAELRGEMAGLRGEMATLEARLTIRLGAGLAASTSILVAVGLLT